METIAAFVNSAEHARHVLHPMVHGGEAPASWIVVACAPRLNRHVGRWVPRASRRQWQERWSSQIFSALEPLLRLHAGSQMQTVLAVPGELAKVVVDLQARFGELRILDARRPGFSGAEEALITGQPPTESERWAIPLVATTGLSALLSLVD